MRLSTMVAAFLLMASSATAEVGVREVDCWVSSNLLQSVDCYRITVPLDRNDPSSGSADLAVAVFRASAPNPAPDPVIYLEGGPGGPAFESGYPDHLDYSSYWWDDSSSMRRTRDFIVFDQRGIGLSAPSLDCAELHRFDETLPNLLHYDDNLIGPELAALGACYQRLRSEGVPLEQFDTRNSADDVADIVRALGYDSVNLYGVSYGTRLALEVMRRHPDLVRSAVLDGVYPATADPELTFAEAVAGAFNNLFEDCAADRACAAMAPDAREAFEAMIADLNQSPRELELYDLDYFDKGTYVRFDGNMVTASMFEYLYDADWLPYIPLMVGTASKGDLDALTYFYWPKSWADAGMAEGSYANVECREAQTLDAGAYAREASKFGIYGDLVEKWSLVPICEVWPVARKPLELDGPVVSDIPTLLLSGRYDPVTPASYAEEAAQTLSSHRHLVFRSGGHAATFSFDCAMKLAASFFEQPDPVAVRAPRCGGFTDPADFTLRF
ncbi:MAG: alpha/beta fold hydrolase [Rhodospirillaceae bacterium]|nr:alpha/beta fold hydrolase [Rhodospirillaceae bacterium]